MFSMTPCTVSQVYLYCCQSTVFIASKSFGLLSGLTALPPITIARSVSACILSTVDPCWGTFASLCVAEAMALALIILVVLLVILGETHHMVILLLSVCIRGKAVLVTLMVPLIFFFMHGLSASGVNVLIGCFYLQVRLPL